jgi:hypothetical protein
MLATCSGEYPVHSPLPANSLLCQDHSWLDLMLDCPQSWLWQIEATDASTLQYLIQGQFVVLLRTLLRKDCLIQSIQQNNSTIIAL